ncbi:MAG: hypothetical protein JNM07_13075 [Phycisphaerae bacterium]|nr:hypothetical protein [Phycisphaerae bacterium]
MTRDRAFALVLVVMLSLVVGVTGVIILDRVGIGRLASDSQVEVYKSHHSGAGMNELFKDWARTVKNDVASNLTPDGLAFEVKLPRDGLVRMYLGDAQGAALRKPRGLTEPALSAARRAARTLAASGAKAARGVVGTGQALLREVGPARVSLNSAPEPVLLAVAQASMDGDAAQQVVNAIMIKRAQGPIRQLELAGIMEEAVVKPDERTLFESLVEATPTLWWAEADVLGAGGRVEERWAGLIEVRPVNETSGERFGNSGPVLEWARIRPEESRRRNRP